MFYSIYSYIFLYYTLFYFPLFYMHVWPGVLNIKKYETPEKISTNHQEIRSIASKTKLVQVYCLYVITIICITISINENKR